MQVRWYWGDRLLCQSKTRIKTTTTQQQTTKQQPRQPKAEIKQLEREEADLDARLREADARLSRIAAIAEAQAKLDAQLQVLARAAAEQNAR